MRHRLSIGTIVSDASFAVKYVGGGRIGTVEEWFINQLRPGDVFWFAGRPLEFVRVKELTAFVRRSREQSEQYVCPSGTRSTTTSCQAHQPNIANSKAPISMT